jgi:replication factor C subunit 3/5
MYACLCKGPTFDASFLQEHRLQCGTKAIFHLEAFVAKFMAIYKRFLLSLEAF